MSPSDRDCGCESPRLSFVFVDGVPMKRIAGGTVTTLHTFSPPTGFRIAWSRGDPSRYFRVMEGNDLNVLLEVRDEVIVAAIEEPIRSLPVRAMLLVHEMSPRKE